MTIPYMYMHMIHALLYALCSFPMKATSNVQVHVISYCKRILCPVCTIMQVYVSLEMSTAWVSCSSSGHIDQICRASSPAHREYITSAIGTFISLVEAFISRGIQEIDSDILPIILYSERANTRSHSMGFSSGLRSRNIHVHACMYNYSDFYYGRQCLLLLSAVDQLLWLYLFTDCYIELLVRWICLQLLSRPHGPEHCHTSRKHWGSSSYSLRTHYTPSRESWWDGNGNCKVLRWPWLERGLHDYQLWAWELRFIFYNVDLDISTNGLRTSQKESDSGDISDNSW